MRNGVHASLNALKIEALEIAALATRLRVHNTRSPLRGGPLRRFSTTLMRVERVQTSARRGSIKAMTTDASVHAITASAMFEYM